MEPKPPRVAVIEGHRVLVIERTPPIPDDLSLLLNGGRDRAGRPWAALRVAVRQPLRLDGARAACLDQDHRLAPWVEGFHTGSDGVNRTLHLLACRDCGSVCVRDVSFDSLDRLRTGRRGPARRNHVIGWYSGARRGQRVYT